MKQFYRMSAVFFAALIGGVSSASAGDVSIYVVDTKDKKVEYAVVSLKPLFAGAISFVPAQAAIMQQEGSLFSPFVLAVKTGTSVSMPNLDDYSHHVYSFSPAKRFEQKLYSKNQSVQQLFDKPGKVALGCNIHDNMKSYIYVTDHPVYGVTGAEGTLSFQDIPDGSYEVHVWHPGQARGTKTKPKIIAVVSGAERENIVVKLRRRPKQRPPAEDDYN